MKKIIFLLLFAVNFAIAQTPSETFNEVGKRVFNSISDGNWKVVKKEGQIDIGLSWLGSTGINSWSQEFKDGKREMGWYNNYPKMNKKKSFNYKLDPVFYEYTGDNTSNSFFVWYDSNTNLEILDTQEFKIGDKSYIRFFDKGINYEEGWKYYWNKYTDEKRTGPLSSNRSSMYKFCESTDCTMFLELNNSFDFEDLENEVSFLHTRPILFDLDVYNNRIKNINSSNDIMLRIADPDNKLGIIAQKAVNSGEVNFSDIPGVDGNRQYKLIFGEEPDPILKGHYKVDNHNFSINEDFELYFNSSKTTGLKADHKIIISLGFSGTDLDPIPEPGSKGYHLKFKIEQTGIYEKYFRNKTYFKADKTYFIVEKYLSGLRIENKRFLLQKNYLDSDEQQILFKVNRIGNDIYFSIGQDLLYQTEVGKLQRNKVIIDHKDLGESPMSFYPSKYAWKKDKEFNNSKISTVVFSNPINTQNSSPNGLTSSEWKGNGSGFFISNKGYIATNFHVIEGAKEIEVSFNDGLKNKSFSAELTISDPANDLAILKINSSSFNLSNNIPYTIKMRSSDIGSEVFALGFPMALSGMGEDIKFTDGKISSKSGFNGDLRLYQTTTPIQPGNSGGPLFDFNGNLIAINSAKISSDKADNVSYSIKSSYLINLMDGLTENISFPNNNILSGKPLTELIKELSKYVVLIKVK